MSSRLLIFLAAAALAACNSPQRYQSNHSAARTWLESGSGRAAANLTGKWVDATDEDWGEANLVQKDGRVTGRLGNYEADGVVSGSHVNLALKSDDWYYYAVTAVIRDGVIDGYYSREFPPKLVKGKSSIFRLDRAP